LSFSLLSHDGVAGAEDCWMQPTYALSQPTFALSQPTFAIGKTLGWVFHISNGLNNRVSNDKSGLFVKKWVSLLKRTNYNPNSNPIGSEKSRKTAKSIENR